MSRLITNNFAAKILALLFAAGLWMYVVSGESQVINFPSSIPIQTRFAAESLIAKTSLSEARITIITERSNLRKLSADSFTAYVDLSGLTKGTHADIPVKVTSNSPDVQVKSIDPSVVTVTLDPSVRKTIPVAIKIEGQAGEGLAPDDPKVEPENVEVGGAKSDVDSILEATATIRLNKETQTVNKTVPLQGLDAKGKEVADLRFAPPEVAVTIPIVKAGKTKTVGIKVVLNGTPDSGFWLSQITSEPSAVSITGNADILANTQYIQTKPIDIEGLNANRTNTITLDPPSGITLYDDISSVKVSLTVAPIDSTREVTAAINTTGLDAALKLSDPSSVPIKVLVSGPTNLLETLNTSNVIINLDLSSYKTAGTYNINISRDAITTPVGTAAARFNPSAISVKIENK